MPEIQVPDKIDPQSPGDYLEIMSKVVFQSGMPYKIVESKCPGRKEAFHDFDAAKVAGMTPSEIDSLTQARHEGHQEPAQTGSHDQQLSESTGIRSAVRRFPEIPAHSCRLPESGERHAQAVQVLGGYGLYYYLYVVGEEVPDYQEYQASLKNRFTPETSEGYPS